VAHLILSRTATGSSVRFAAAFACAFLAREGACAGSPSAVAAAMHPMSNAKPTARSLSEALSSKLSTGLQSMQTQPDLSRPPHQAMAAELVAQPGLDDAMPNQAAGGLGAPPPKRARGDMMPGRAGADPALLPIVRQCAHHSTGLRSYLVHSE